MLPKEGYEVVISGIGGKFPETNNIAELQEKLFASEELVTVDDRRWPPGVNNTPKACGKVLEEYKYDAAFFGVHRKLCASAEPMMKLTAERCYEAMIDAGVNPFSLRGRNIAVIVGSTNSESEILTLTHDGLLRDGFGILGHSQTLIANRVSYFFNFVGPSFAVNFSNTGGIFGLQYAATLIRQGAIAAALVTTPYLMWSPSVSKEFVDLGLLTFENKCRPFDDGANGFIRSDGVVSYFLQRKEDANRIYATIVNTDCTCIGSRDSGLVKFDDKLKTFLMNFYKNSGCNPSLVAYVEPEGMAVKDLDAAELNSLANVLYPKRKTPLLIGSVSGNTGYAHNAASFMALAKAIIAMETGMIPPTLHYQTPNTRVPALIKGDLKVVTKETPLEGDLVAVNNITYSGTAGHILLRRHNKEKVSQSSEELPVDGLHRLVLLSARHQEGATTVIKKIQTMKLDTEFVALVNDIHKTNIPNHLYRSFAVLPTQVNSKLEISFLDTDKPRPVWFVFSGMGSQWNGMGKELLKIPIFAQAIQKCDKVLKPKGVDLNHILTTDDPAVFDNILNCFVGIASVQIGLLDILKAVGIKPDGIIGHSAGELGCGYADGCLTAEEMILTAWARGRAAIDGNLIKGLMAAVGLGYNEIKDKLPASVDVACHNAQDSCTISGPLGDVQQVIKELKDKNIFAKAVNTTEKAFHSRYIIPIAANLNKLLKKIILKPKERSACWISTSVEENCWATEDGKIASATYYTNNLINPVLFEEGCALVPKDAIVVEIAPHGLMQAILRRSLSQQCINIPLTSRSAESNVVHLFNALGKLYTYGIDLNVNTLYPPVQYPVSRGTPSLAPIVTWDHTDTWFTEYSNILKMMTEEKSEMTVRVDDCCDEYEIWSQHCVENTTVLPLSQLLEYAWKVLFHTNKLDPKLQGIVVEQVVVTGQLAVKTSKQAVETSVLRGSRKFEVCLCTEDGTKPCITGTVSAIKQPHLVMPELQTNGHKGIKVSKAEFYSVLAQHHYQLGPKFQVVQSACILKRDLKAVVTWTGDMVVFLDSLFKLFVFLHLENKQKIVKINSFRRLIIDTPHFFALPEGTELEINYNSSTNMLCCEGLHLEGPTVSSHDAIQTKTSPFVWKSVKFVAYSENILKLENFINMSVQLVAEQGLNSWSNKVASFVTLEVRSDINKPFLASVPLQELLKSTSHMSSRIQVKELQRAKEDLKQIGQKTCLIMGEYKTLLSLAESTENQRNMFYLTYLPPGTELDNKKLVQVLSHQTNQGVLTLMKKWSDPRKLRVFELDWMAGLRQFMSHNTSGQPVVVVSRHWQPRQALRTLALETYAHQLRCVFLDKQAPQFCLNSPLFYQQLALDLSVNTLSDQMWGSFRTLNLPNITSDTDNLPKLESSMKSLQLNCVALNTRTFTLQPEVSHEQVTMKYLDYCGTRRNGERVMGIARYNHKQVNVIPDQVLMWNIPSQWSFEAAATVPFTYSLAYYSLLLRARLQKGESILIHAGMSPVGQAAIAVSLDHGANLYVTVSEESEVSQLIAAFPQININQIIVMERSNFELEVKKLTKKKGVKVVMNCLKGKEMNASFRLLSTFSRMIHLSDINIEDKEEIGMLPFAKYCDLIGVSLDNLLNANEEDKIKLKVLVEDGIKRKIVRPLKFKPYSLQKTADALHNLKMNNLREKTVLLKPEYLKDSFNYQCNPHDSFIVIGTKQGLWLEVAHWLLKNGAKKLVIASLKQNLSMNISRKFNNFMNQHDATIVMTTVSRLTSHEGAEEFIKEAIAMGPLGGIFCTFMEEKSALVTHLDYASRLLVPQLQQFVCLLGGSASVCQSRAELGLSACLVQSESPLSRPQVILPYLTSVLSDNSSASAYYSYLISDEGSTVKHKGMAVSLQDVKNYLPTSLRDLESFGYKALLGQPQLEEYITHSPGYQFVRYQLVPVFLIPALDIARLDPLIKQLIHPAFCPQLPPCRQTVEESAEELLQHIQLIQKKGPYNIVAELWSGPVALQLATLLEAQGHQVEVFLLDAAPETTQMLAKAFCLQGQELCDARFLTTLLSLSGSVPKQLTELETWEEKLQFALECVTFPPELQQSAQVRVGLGLTALRSHLKAVLAFQQPSQQFSGNVHLLRTRAASDTDYCGLKKHCKKTPTIYVMEDETLDEILENPKTAAIINENLAFTWDL